MARARPLGHVNFFPTYTVGEDFALGFELKRYGYSARYLDEYLGAPRPASLRRFACACCHAVEYTIYLHKYGCSDLQRRHH